MMNPSPNPPKYVQRFFEWFCHRNHFEGLEGDLYELFERRFQQHGRWKARAYYLLDMLTLLRSSVAKPLKIRSNSHNMELFKNYLKTAVRMAIRRKQFSLINIFGLTLGITSVLFITLFVMDELAYDQHISNADTKYRIYNKRMGKDGETNLLPIVPPIFAPSLKANFEQVEQAGRVIFDYGGTIFTVGDKPYSEKSGFYIEPQVLDILDVELVAGDISELNDKYKMLVSESLFRKFFGDTPFSDYASQTVNLGEQSLIISGVFKDFPEHSHLQADYIFSFAWALDQIAAERMNSWVWQQFYTYIQLKPGTDISEFTELSRKFISEKSRPDTEAYGFHYETNYQLVRDIHLRSTNFEWDIAKTGNYQSTVFLIIAASIILLIASLNFINLTTAQSLKRAKEVCVRKIIGAQRRQLLVQCTFESILFTTITGIISLILVIVLLPIFNDFTGKSFEIATLLSLKSIAIYVGIILLLGILSGFYPAFLITSFKPLTVIHGLSTVKVKRSSGILKIDIRKLLVGAQYVLSIGLILISLIMQQQFNFLQKTDMGFKKENLLVIPLTRSLKKDHDLTREKFGSHSNIESVSLSYGTPGGIVAGDGVHLPTISEREFSSNMFIVDHNYISTMKMDMVAGRDFSEELGSDEASAFIINETAVQNFGFASPEEALGTSVTWKAWNWEDSLKRGEIVGVVRDFNFKSLHTPISSSVLHIYPLSFQNLIVRVGAGNLQETIKHIETQFRTFEPSRPFEYQFVDQSFKQYYESEQKLSQLFSLFTVLAIFTAIIGLFGLVSFNVVSKRKEISIRKVLGAGTNSIFRMLVRQYFILVSICLIIAIPMSIYLATDWLQNFAYRIDIGAITSIQVIVITFLLTLATVGFQAFRGANANPTERLKSE